VCDHTSCIDDRSARPLGAELSSTPDSGGIRLSSQPISSSLLLSRCPSSRISLLNPSGSERHSAFPAIARKSLLLPSADTVDTRQPFEAPTLSSPSGCAVLHPLSHQYRFSRSPLLAPLGPPGTFANPGTQTNKSPSLLRSVLPGYGTGVPRSA